MATGAAVTALAEEASTVAKAAGGIARLMSGARMAAGGAEECRLAAEELLAGTQCAGRSPDDLRRLMVIAGVTADSAEQSVIAAGEGRALALGARRCRGRGAHLRDPLLPTLAA